MSDFSIDKAIPLVVEEVAGERPLAVDQEGRYQGLPPIETEDYHPLDEHRLRQAPFRVLISCLISLRTKDEVTDPATERLFKLADSPATMADLTAEEIAATIYPAGFYNRKGETIRQVSRRLLDDYAGTVPDTIDELIKLKGVGRKTANLVVTVGHGKPGICVDIHVHRITNRWGYVCTKTPDATERALREKLPAKYWIPINSLLVVFGRNRCKPTSPLCSDCSLQPLCSRIGVTHSR